MTERSVADRRTNLEYDDHHPSCCGACDECLRICDGYHGPERRGFGLTADRCYLCNRREVDMNVTLDGAVRGLCSTCWERGQDEIRIPLDMTEDEGGDDG